MADDRDFFDSAASQARMAIRAEVARRRALPFWHAALLAGLAIIGLGCLVIAYLDAFGGL